MWLHVTKVEELTSCHGPYHTILSQQSVRLTNGGNANMMYVVPSMSPIR